MVGSHEARRAHAGPGHLAHVSPEHQSGCFFCFFGKLSFIFWLAQCQILQKAKRNNSKRKNLGIWRRKVCCELYFEKPWGPGPWEVRRRDPAASRSAAKPGDVTKALAGGGKSREPLKATTSRDPTGPRGAGDRGELGAGGGTARGDLRGPRPRGGSDRTPSFAEEDTKFFAGGHR